MGFLLGFSNSSGFGYQLYVSLAATVGVNRCFIHIESLS